LHNVVKSKLQIQDFDRVLSNLVEKLTHVRCILNAVQVAPDVTKMNELRIQCIMFLFLNDIFKTCNVEMEATAANSDFIELTVETDGDNERWKGYTDLKVSRIGSMSIHDAVAAIEMKKPFSEARIKSDFSIAARTATSRSSLGSDANAVSTVFP
jgi:hypothetical protein